jgi:hypothetical protein
MLLVHELTVAARGLASHPQDHGWRPLYELFEYGLNNLAPTLTEVLLASYDSKPTSATHLLTLLGIAIKANSKEALGEILQGRSFPERLGRLEEYLQMHSTPITRILRTRQNSFTCARRFLVPQVLLGSIFSAYPGAKIVFADLGTGLGLLPRQINSLTQYELFAPDLTWPGGIPRFTELQLSAIYGIDRPPLPDPSWVAACYGYSDYYNDLHRELEAVLDDPSVQAAKATYVGLDLLDYGALAEFIHASGTNAANLCYVLYELDSSIRGRVIQTIVESLHSPAILLVIEPRNELHQQGCLVELYQGSAIPEKILAVSDGHFKGRVIPAEDYERFISRYPIRY